MRRLFSLPRIRWRHQLAPAAPGRKRERGVGLVEAAFVTPVFFTMLFGIIEGGMYMNDKLATSNAVRAGAREASAFGADGKADMYTLASVRKQAGALRKDQFEYVVIYKASGYGEKPSTTCMAGTSVTGVCNVYTYSDIQKAFNQIAEEDAQAAAVAAGTVRTVDSSKIWFGCLTAGTNAGNSPDRYWCPGSRADTRAANNRAGPDYVGIYVKIKHPWLTKLFGSNQAISDQSVIQIEPRAEA